MINIENTLFDLFEKPKEVKDKVLPKNINLSSGYVWCPYCSMPVKLIKDKKFGIKKCPICSISEKDYWMKKVNKIKKPLE